MPRAHVEYFEWDDDNEAHVGEHIDPAAVEDMVEGGDWRQVRNKKMHPSTRVRPVGRGSGGRFATVVLEPTSAPGIWRPVTGWWSNKAEIALYYQQGRR